LTVLSHALALQSLLLSTACQVRVGLARDDWDELCRLAWPVWRANQLDTPPRQRKEGSTLTARAVLIEPLLLRLLEPLGLSPLEFDLALDEARRAARVVGIRIDEDAVLHASPEGPVMMLSADYSVQLDTRASTHDLRMRLAMINHGAALSEAGVQATLARPQVRSVMERLAEVWGAGSMPRPLMRPPLPRALVHWGLPAPWLLSAPAADTAQDDPMIDALAAQSETLVWRGSDARRAVFTRSVPTPRLCLGQLVTLLPWRVHEGRVMRPVQRVGNEPHGLMMGRIVTLTHTGSPHSRQPFAHDVGVVFWAGTPQRVLFRRAGQSELAEGWCFAGNAQEPPCLIIPRDAFEGPSDIRGVLGGRELTLSCLRLLERGIDFDRVELAPLEPPLV
jgi:hypothetical protein